MGCMLLARLAQVSQQVAATSARSKKTALLADLFREAEPDDVPIVIRIWRDGCPRVGWGWAGRC